MNMTDKDSKTRMSAAEGRAKSKPDPMDIHVGQRLKMRRSLLGMSQEQLADFIGLTFQQIQKYERGANRISASRLHSFSRILQVPIDFFFDNFKDNSDGSFSQDANMPAYAGLSDNKQAPLVQDEDIMKSKETIELLRAYYSVEDKAKRKDLLKLFKSMTENMSSKD
jgi:transcriptional regulator with XRE-family HTH domain